MSDAFRPVPRRSLADALAQRIRKRIHAGEYQLGDRLPPITEMARRFGVGHPTVREALKKLQALGMVEIRHGSGVYVSRAQEVLVLASPEYTGVVSKKLLLDLVEARIPIEVQSAMLAARHASGEQLGEMRRLLTSAGESLEDDEVLTSLNMAFHGEIARASGNSVLAQLLAVLQELFVEEQRAILRIFGSRQRDHEEHLQILEALERRDEALAAERMRAHLQGVQEVLVRWNPDRHPVG